MVLYIKAFLFIISIIILGADAPFPVFYFSKLAGLILLVVSVRLIIKGELKQETTQFQTGR
jgi:hypothetical protein